MIVLGKLLHLEIT